MNDRQAITEVIRDKTVLITGGTGSFGNEILSELFNHEPKHVRVLSRDEKKQYDM